MPNQGLNDLFLQLESEARQRAHGLGATCKLSHNFVERHYGSLLPIEERELRRLKAAGRAATDVATFVALCRGEKIPARRLNSDLLAYHKRRNDGG